MAALVHPSAIIADGAQISDGVVIGPHAIIGPEVVIGASCEIHAFAQVIGQTTLGARNRIHSHAVIGGDPQDKKYRGEPTTLVIGDDNLFRESVTVNRGTVQDGGVTRIGSRNWVMAYAHIAHDCQIGSDTIIANACQIAGHVHIGDFAILGGQTGVHQFVHIGAHAMTGGATALLRDLPPYVLCNGNPAAAHGINSEGLRRRGFSSETIQVLKRAYRTVYRAGLTVDEALNALQAQLSDLAADAESSAALSPLVAFLSRDGRGIVR